MKTIFTVSVVAEIGEWQGEWDYQQAERDRKQCETQRRTLYRGEDWEEALRVLKSIEAGTE
jgi:hypothetical protein